MMISIMSLYFCFLVFFIPLDQAQMLFSLFVIIDPHKPGYSLYISVKTPDNFSATQNVIKHTHIEIMQILTNTAYCFFVYAFE